MTNGIDHDKIRLPDVAPLATLEGAQAAFKAVILDGEMSYCPCCGEVAKVYARGLRGNWMMALRYLANKQSYGVKAAKLADVTGSRDYPFLSRWDFIYPPKSGEWIITSRGLTFLRGQLEVPHKFLEYKGNVIHWDNTVMVTVRDLKYDKFDLDEILAPIDVSEYDDSLRSNV